MTLREAIYYTAVCDFCGVSADEDGDYSAWAAADYADAVADGADWHVEGGNHICDDCAPRALDLLDEDEIDPGHGAIGHKCYADTVSAISRVFK